MIILFVQWSQGNTLDMVISGVQTRPWHPFVWDAGIRVRTDSKDNEIKFKDEIKLEDDA